MSSSSRPILPPIDSPPPLDIPVLAPDAGSDTIRTARPAHTNVLARLHALFPSSPHTQPSPSAQTPHPAPDPTPPPPPPKPKFIKVRILTWNMHDSLPKGDVEELLGSVPTSNPSLPPPPDAPQSLPVFPASPEHPYHIVIVAGQECPSASGIPMALGAGFRLKDNSRSRHSLLPLDVDESIHRKSAETEILSPTIEKTHEHHHPLSSWSSVLENWYCNPPAAVGPLPATTSDSSVKTQHELQQIGPYELLIKERMMGLYLAVFIHRDARPFVQGTSKSAVTAGLIGGRVGNKGGVGVSVNLDGTTLLFINAHLAAHEGRMHHRLADLAKIKAELTVDDYLSPDDPRFMAEDITDRFDTSFIFGDLNFRLDITRLHADWLITRKEYEQALEFDQLRKIMASDATFAGFHEAPICFPPTFKYDVLRTLKRSRTKSLKRLPAILTPHEKLLSEVAELEQEQLAEDDRASQRDEDDPEPDGASIASSAWTSVRSRRTVDPDPDPDDEQDADEASSPRFFLQSPPASASTSKLVHKMWSATAAHKAKEKWISIFNSNNPKSPSYKEHAKSNGNAKTKRQSWRSPKSVKSPETPRRASQPSSSDSYPQTPVDPGDPRQTRAGRANELQTALLDAFNARPHKHLALSVNNVDLEEEDKGVYDSSHKQRVPSWCDRILWKSTMVPEHDSDTEDAESQRFMPLRAKMGQLFSALRPSSMRSRRDSTWSMNHPDLSQTPIPGEPTPHPHPHLPPHADRRHPPASRVHSPTRKAHPHPLRRISQTRSVDSLQRSSSDERSLARVHTLEHSGPSLALAPSSGSGSGRGVPLRHANTISPVMPVASGDASASSATSPTLVSPGLDSPLELEPPATAPSPSAPMFRWLLPFFYKDGPQQQDGAQGAATPRAEPPLPPPPPPRRGDVVCLRYDTLDDRGMRRLEGRSDHRPVIGSYAVYV